MNSKRVTLLIDSVRGGGAERVCTTVASGLAENGWDVNLVVVDLDNAAYLGELSSNVNLINLDTKQIYSAKKLFKYFSDNKTDKVIVFNHQLTVIVVLLKKIFRFNFKIISRNINTLSKIVSLDYKNKPIRKWLVIKYYKKADFFVNQCEDMEKDLLSFFPELNGKTTVIYNPAAKSIENYVSFNNILDTPKEDFLLCVGRLSSQKSFDLAIYAFSMICDEYPDLKLKILGVGDKEKELKDLAVELNVSDRVFFEGFKSDVISYYLKAKVLLLTSEFEGFPNVLVESITLGTPVVSFDIESGPREIIKDGVNGFLVKDRNVQLFADKIKLSLQMDYERNDLKNTIVFTSNDNVLAKWGWFLRGL